MIKKITALCISLYICIYAIYPDISIAQNSDTSYKSVVQVMTYQDIFGKYPVLMGWGSASIISSGGVLLTNNHVVSDNQGKTMGSFLICVSNDANTSPNCDYTASLITKDAKKDIAMLKIDPVDIYGKTVDYNKFDILGLDYDYDTKAKDQVTAIGYPGIGGETITQTVGVVAGADILNENKYIKTDALIAPGNSGGPMIHDGKIIGVNTFVKGGFFDPTIGYALHISQARDFIQSNISKNPVSTIIDTSIFQKFLKDTRDIYSMGVIQDSLFDIQFHAQYIIQNYIPNTQIEGRLANSDDQNIQYFSIRKVSVPNISTNDDFVYILKNYTYFEKGTSKLLKRNIGGFDFREVAYDGDLSQGEPIGFKTYIAKYDNQNILIMNIYSEYTSDNTKISAIKDNAQKFFDSIKLYNNAKNNYVTGFTSYNPKFSIDLSGAVFNLISPLGYYGDNTNMNFAQYYFGNLHEKLSVSMLNNNIQNGSQKTFDEFYKIATINIPNYRKKTFLLNGQKGFVVCDNMGYSDLGSINNQNSKGQTIDMRSCSAYIIIGSSQDFIMNIYVTLEKKNYNQLESKILDFLKNKIHIYASGDTSMPSSIVYQTKFTVSGLDKQSDGFRALYAKLLEYQLIKDQKNLNLNSPITYKQYIDMYLAFVYNIHSSELSDRILRLNKLNPKGYVNQKLIYSKYNANMIDMQYNWMEFANEDMLDTSIRAIVAGVDIPGGYSSRSIKEFVIFKDSSYASQWQDIVDWEYDIFGSKSFSISELKLSNDTSYIAYDDYIYSKSSGLIGYSKYSPNSLIADNPKNKLPKNISQCLKSKKISSKCQSIINHYVLNIGDSYDVLTYGEAISVLSSYIDIGLFDPDWKAKKDLIQ